jgi:hypothetical protein
VQAVSNMTQVIPPRKIWEKGEGQERANMADLKNPDGH